MTLGAVVVMVVVVVVMAMAMAVVVLVALPRTRWPACNAATTSRRVLSVAPSSGPCKMRVTRGVVVVVVKVVSLPTTRLPAMLQQPQDLPSVWRLRQVHA